MNEQMRRCAVGLVALGLTSSFGLAAVAQEFDEDRYVVEERDIDDDAGPPVVEYDDDDDDDADAVQLRVVYRGGEQRCAATFRSYDSTTGTYVSYDGDTRRCPYLD